MEICAASFQISPAHFALRDENLYGLKMLGRQQLVCTLCTSLANRARRDPTPPVSTVRARCPFAANYSVPSCRWSSAFAEKQSSSTARVMNTSSHVTARLLTRAESAIHGCGREQGLTFCRSLESDQIFSIDPARAHPHYYMWCVNTRSPVYALTSERVLRAPPRVPVMCTNHLPSTRL